MLSRLESAMLSQHVTFLAKMRQGSQHQLLLFRPIVSTSKMELSTSIVVCTLLSLGNSASIKPHPIAGPEDPYWKFAVHSV